MSNLVNDNQSVEKNMLVGKQESDDEISLFELLLTVIDNLSLLVFGPLAVGAAALCVSFLIPPTYTAKTQFLPPQQQSAGANILASLGGLGGLAGAVGGIKNPADQFVAYMQSVTLKDAIIDRFNLLERYEGKTKTQIRLDLMGRVRIASGKDGLMSVEVDDKDPKFAADLANAHVEEFSKLLSSLAITEAQQRRKFFEKQLTITKDKLIQSEIELKTTGVAGSVLKSNPLSALAIVASLQAAVTAQEIKLGSMRGYLAETAPEIKQALSELVTLRAQLAKQAIDSPSIGSKAGSEGDYITKYREFKYQETLFEIFSKQYELAKLDEAREGSLIQVLDTAEPPERKVKPNKAMIAIVATLATGFALLLFVFMRQALDNLGRNSESAKKIAQLKNSCLKAFGRA